MNRVPTEKFHITIAYNMRSRI